MSHAINDKGIDIKLGVASLPDLNFYNDTHV